jgi:hypothetical protein
VLVSSRFSGMYTNTWATKPVYHSPGAMRTRAPDISVDTGNTFTSALLM